MKLNKELTDTESATEDLELTETNNDLSNSSESDDNTSQLSYRVPDLLKQETEIEDEFTLPPPMLGMSEQRKMLSMDNRFDEPRFSIPKNLPPVDIFMRLTGESKLTSKTPKSRDNSNLDLPGFEQK